jgi:hypothetical protein
MVFLKVEKTDAYFWIGIFPIQLCEDSNFGREQIW